MGDLTKNFSRSEFACKDGCGFDGIDVGLVNDLQKVRDRVNRPISVSSGCRCAKHNAATPGSAKTSSHMAGLAIDITCISPEERYGLLVALGSLIHAGEITVLQIELCPTWIHISNDKSKSPKIAYYN